MPQVSQTAMLMFRPTICRAIDNLSGDQIDELLHRAETVIADIRACAEDD